MTSGGPHNVATISTASSSDTGAQSNAEAGKSLLLTALGVGALTGLGEVWWAYTLPLLSQAWRTVLPSSFLSLLAFFAAAIVTDGLLILLVGFMVLVVRACIIRAKPGLRLSQRLWTVTRATVLSAGTCYLYVAWMRLHILRTIPLGSVTYCLIFVLGMLVLWALAWSLSAKLWAGKRRWLVASPARLWLTAAVVLAAATIPGFMGHRSATRVQLGIQVTRSGPRPNVLLVTVDTLRADYLACYGHPWIQTPNLDRIARDGVLFETAISQAPRTGPSHGSIMTSLYPFDHDGENGRPMKRGLVTLADVLNVHGYETVAFTSALTTCSTTTGLQQGFDRYVDSLISWSELFGHDEIQNLVFFRLYGAWLARTAGLGASSEIRGEVVTDRAMHWLEHRTQKPFFAWLHYFDPHAPYDAPLTFRGMYQDQDDERKARYAEEISYVDAQVGRFIDALREKGLYDDTLIIVTSDHGEAFGESHDGVVEFGHTYYLYDTTQRVPLLIKPAHARNTQRRLTQQVELMDIAPTILSILEMEIPAEFVGESLVEALDGRPLSPEGRDALSFSIIETTLPDSDAARLAYVRQFSVRSAEWKYILIPRADRAELYDLVLDPQERTNIVATRPEIAAHRHAQLVPFLEADQQVTEDPRQNVAPEFLNRLKSLGYLGGTHEDEDAETNQPQ